MKTALRLLSTLLLAAAALAASAKPSVSYTVSGGPGAYVLDFTVTNTLGGTNGLYFFGVDTSFVSGKPTDWKSYSYYSWNNASRGGSNRVYDSIWMTNAGVPSLAPGASLSSFSISTSTLPTGGVHWFAYASGGNYSGGDNFNGNSNPGFEGIAPQATPEPSAIAALGLGVASLLRRRRK